MKIKRFIGGLGALIIIFCSSLIMDGMTYIFKDEEVGSVSGAFLTGLLAWLFYRLIVGKDAGKFKSFRLQK